jgi:Xaa-Pro aminopeptidase
MVGVIPYPFRQDADFFYLTGITTPMSVAIIHGGGTGHMTTFVPNLDTWVEQWDGARLSPEASCEYFGADEAYPISEMPKRLNQMVSEASSVVYDADRHDGFDRSSSSTMGMQSLPAFVEAMHAGRTQRLRPLMHSLRWVKSSAELALMKQSSQIAGRSIMRCMQASYTGRNGAQDSSNNSSNSKQITGPGGRVGGEHQLAALFEYQCKTAGAHRMAYPPVVASGMDACTIHYSRNDKQLHSDTGDLMLLDGGCEMYGYCSDITRTWPLNGQYSAAQREVYDIVLSVHAACMEACQPGATLRDLHLLSCRLLMEGIGSLGFLDNNNNNNNNNNMIGTRASSMSPHAILRTVYPHSVGHWLGLDTHDTNTVPQDKPLQPGVVITIEPGLYIPHDEGRYGKYAGIGVRIEDVVSLREGGCEVLSGEVPVEAGEVENLVRS